MIGVYANDIYSPVIWNGYKLKYKIINSIICILIFMYISQVVKYKLFFLELYLDVFYHLEREK